MSKKSNKRRKNQVGRQTNWTVVYGIIGAGVIGLLALLVLNQQPQTLLSLEDRCDEEGSCVAFGEASAPVQIIEILDFGCTHCRDFHEDTAVQIDEAYVQTGQAQFIYYPYALNSATLPAANASLCANEQDAYMPFVDELFAQFEVQGIRERSGLLRVAETVGLEMTQFESCVDNGRYNDVIQENIEIARQNRITSTPTFLINGRQISGAFPFETFRQEIEGLLNTN